MIKEEITITLVKEADGALRYKGEPQITHYWYPSDFARKLMDGMKKMRETEKEE